MMKAHARRRPWCGAVLALAALLAGPAPGARSADAPPDAASLKRQAEHWWAARKRVATRCFQCNGRGKIRWGRKNVTCPKCKGTGIYVDPGDWKKCWWSMRSPAFRAVKGARDKIEQEFKAWKVEIVSTFIIDGDPEIDAPGYGIVRVKVNHDKDPIEQRWIAEDGDWWLYEASADGKWAAPPEPDAEEPEKLEPLSPADLAKVQKTVKTSGTVFKATAASLNDKGWIIVRMDAPEGMPRSWEIVLKDAVEATRSILDRYPYAGARLEWWHGWRDSLGRVEKRLGIVTTLSREKNEAAVWANLNLSERAKVLTWKRLEYEGWIPWPR